MLTYLRSKIPLSLKQVARRKVIDPAKRSLDDWRLRRLIEDLRNSSMPYVETLEAIRHAWGNESFSADISYINELVSRVEKCSAPILECGSGVTTIIAGVLAQKRGLAVWSLEQDREWAQLVDRRLKRNGIHNVVVSYAPLQEYNGFVWYKTDDVELPRHFDLVLCDGPAVFEHWGYVHKQWRYGVVPSLVHRGITIGEILLDDATEPRGENVLLRWKEEFGLDSSITRTEHGDFAVVGSRRPYAGSMDPRPTHGVQRPCAERSIPIHEDGGYK